MWLCFMNLLREPGIRFHPDPFPENYLYDLRLNFCKICHIVKKPKTIHCAKCNVCI